jgi:soluble lytic murein transglycosylase
MGVLQGVVNGRFGKPRTRSCVRPRPGYKEPVQAKWRWVKWVALLVLAVGVLRWWRLAHRESSQDPAILAAAHRYDVDAALIKAVVWRESRFDPLARGSKGEIGLMQLMRDTGKEWAAAEKILLFQPEQLFDPGRNTAAGAWYLKKALQRYRETDNPIPYALAEYNAGRGNVLRWAKGPAATNSQQFLGQITFPGTREYVRSVLRRHEKYRQTFPPKK